MKKNEKGFTLIEIIVVIVMIGVLAAIAVPIYSGYVLRARASEGITTLGAIKTFVLERKNSTGLWPGKDDIMKEFHNFNELYYFVPNVDVKPQPQGLGMAIALTAKNEFGLPDNFTDPRMQLDISLEPDGKNTGWSGGIVIEYAKHLPVCTEPLT